MRKCKYVEYDTEGILIVIGIIVFIFGGIFCTKLFINQILDVPPIEQQYIEYEKAIEKIINGDIASVRLSEYTTISLENDKKTDSIIISNYLSQISVRADLDGNKYNIIRQDNTSKFNLIKYILQMFIGIISIFVYIILIIIAKWIFRLTKFCYKRKKYRIKTHMH